MAGSLGRVWPTREELRIAIVTWLETTYHRRRRHAGLGRLTPVEYELVMTTVPTRAAQPNRSPLRAADRNTPEVIIIMLSGDITPRRRDSLVRGHAADVVA